jgi:hypothetical protein
MAGFWRCWTSRSKWAAASLVLFGLIVSGSGIAIAAATDSAETMLKLSSEKKAQGPVSPAPAPSMGDQPRLTADQLTHEFKMAQQRFRLYQCILLATFALVAHVILLRHLCGKNMNCTPMHLVNASGLILIIFGTLFLILLADVDEQLNAGIGIIGAVAGYLFGSMRRTEPLEQKEQKVKSEQ